MTKYLIVENEMLARKELERKISRLRPDWEYAGFAETVKDVVKILGSSKDIGLVFMDIELDDGQCFQIFDNIDTDVDIIFTTAYSEYALKAFHLNSLDYLLKPFSLEALEQSIKKYERYSEASYSEDRPSIDVPSSNVNNETAKKVCVPRILIQQGDRYSYVPTEKIAWLESEDKYVFCIDDKGHKWLTGFKSLRELELSLSDEEFCRLRRNIIASISSVSNVHKFVRVFS